MLSIKSWLFPSRDNPNGGPAGADADNGQNPPASESIYVPPAKSKRASMPDTAGSKTGTVVSDSKVLRRFNQRSAKFMSRGNEHDPIEVSGRKTVA
jgi:hypothetical protein